MFVGYISSGFVLFCMGSRVFPLAGNPLDAVAKKRTGVVFKDQDDNWRYWCFALKLIYVCGAGVCLM